ncbi:MAG: hypothetical protein SR1Q7_09960 [Quinella sp. 1Q7]|nr:hypothetical protein [Quinella sp. 1Q7]
MNIILIVFGGVAFVLCVYGLFAVLTFSRKRVLDMVGDNGLAYLSMIAWMLTFTAGAAYWTYSSIDFDSARSLRQYVHSFTATYFAEGGLCLFLTYGFSQMNNVEHNGKRTLIIAGGILLGLLAIVLGLQRLLTD